MALATVRTVPSPPTATTTSAPLASASLGACAAVLVELRVDEFHVGQSLVTAELFDVRAPLGGLRLGRVHDEDVMHLIVVAFDELLRQSLVAAGAKGERHGDDEDDDAGDDGYGDDGG